MTLHLFVNPLVVWIWIGGAIVGRRRRSSPCGRSVEVAGRPSSEPQRSPAAASVGGCLTDATLRWLLVPLLVIAARAGSSSPASAATRARLPRRSSASRRPAWTPHRARRRDGLRSADLAGRPYVVNFWASWCIPACVDEHPVLAAAHESIRRESHRRRPLPGRSRRRGGASWPATATRGTPHLIDANGSLAIDYGVTGPPESYFVDAEGIVRAKQFGPLTDEIMTENLAASIRASSR